MRSRRTIFAAAVLLAFFQAIKTGAATLPPGFQETIVFSGLTRPTAVRFASDGRVFVAEKSGLIKVFESLSSPTPTIFADLRTEIDDYWDRGLLGLALHPNFPTTPYVYVLYSYDAPIGGTAPTWNDGCPNPPGTANGCVISGRLSRLTAAGSVMTGVEEVLLEAWGQQFPSHSIGDLHFGPDGSLYVSGGDGSSFNNVDYGQFGIPKNPLGDPPLPVGTPLASPDAEGGSLRSQSLLRAAGGPVLTNGAILRVDGNGNALPDNPLFAQHRPDRAARRGVRPAQSVPLHDTTGNRITLDRRRGLGLVGRDQSARQSDRFAGGELRLAVLRGRRPAGRLPGGQPLALQQPLQLIQRGHKPVLQVRAHQQGRLRRDLSDR